MSCEYVNGFKCKWAVSSDTFEDAYHRALDEYRCIYLELDHNGKGVERSPIHSRYLTKDEAESLPRFDRSEVPASWSNVKRNKALSKSGLDRCDKRPNIELFKISAKSALKQIDNSIGLPFMDRQNYKPRF